MAGSESDAVQQSGQHASSQRMVDNAMVFAAAQHQFVKDSDWPRHFAVHDSGASRKPDQSVKHDLNGVSGGEAGFDDVELCQDNLDAKALRAEGHLHSTDDHGEGMKAMLVSTAGMEAPINEQTQEEIFRKVQRRLLPLYIMVVTACYIDRHNLAFASIQMNRDLNFSPVVYGIGASMFFITAAAFQIPSNLLLFRVGANRWLGLIMFGWGIIAVCFAFIKNAAGFMIVRLLLGAAEAGALPGLWFHISLFFPDDRISLPYAVIEGTITASQVVAAPLAAIVLQLNGVLGLEGWQWLFIVQGVPMTVLGVVLCFALPRDPFHLKSLTRVQMQWLSKRVDECRDWNDESSLSSWQMHKAAWGMRHVKFIGVLKLMKDCMAFGLLLWAPIIIARLLNSSGRDNCLTNIEGQAVWEDGSEGAATGWGAVLLSTLPFAVAAIVTLLNAIHSRRTGERRLHTAIPYLIGGVVCILIPASCRWTAVVSFIALKIALVGSQCGNGPLVGLLGTLSHGPGIAASLTVYNAFGTIGGAFGPFIVGLGVQFAGGYTIPMAVLGGVLVAAGLLACFLTNPPRTGPAGDMEMPANDPLQVMMTKQKEAAAARAAAAAKRAVATSQHRVAHDDDVA